MIRCMRLFSIIIMIFSFCADVSGQDRLRYLNSTLWTFNSDALVEGNILYASMDIGLQVWDITDKTSPVFLAQHYFETGSGEALAKTGNYLIQAYDIGGLKIYDVSAPDNPEVVKEIGGIGVVKDLVLAGYTLYTVSDRADLRIYDFSDQDNPALLGRLDLDGITSDIEVTGDHAFIPYYSTAPGCYVIDISDKASPAVIDTIRSDAYWYEVFIQDNRLYGAQDTAGMRIYDISDPDHITELGRYNTVSKCMDVAVNDNYAYLSNFPEGLIIVDVTNPGSPQHVGQDPVIMYAFGRIHYIDGYIYQIHWDPYNAGVQFKDVSNPEEPAYIGRTPAFDYLRYVDVEDGFAYVCAGHQGTFVIDISDQTDIRPVANIKWLNNWMTDVQGNYAYLVSTDHGLKVVDVSDPTHPVAMDSIDVPGAARGLFAAGDYVYISSWEYLVTVDVSDKDSIRIIDTYEGTGQAISIDVEGNYAYVASRDSGMIIFDLTDPAHPARSGRYPLPLTGNPRGTDVCVVGNYAYFAVQNNALHIVDITNPADPQPVSQYSAGGIDDMFKYGNYLGLANLTAGVEILSLEDRENPLSVFKYDTPGSAKGIYFDSNHVFVADNNSMLLLTSILTEIDEDPDEKGNGSAVNNFRISQNYPNPFNPHTYFEFNLRKDGYVELVIYNVLGQRIRDLVRQSLAEDTHIFSWDGRDQDNQAVSSGIYFYELRAHGQTVRKKMMLVR